MTYLARVLACALMLHSSLAFSQDKPGAGNAPPATQDSVNKLQNEVEKLESAVEAISQKFQKQLETEFAGVKFGAGMAVAAFGKKYRKRVTEAQIVNGVVRASEESTSVARLMLETHYLFARSDKDQCDKWYKPCPDGHGPFIAFQPGTKEVIEAIGIGWMIAYRRDKEAKDIPSKDSFNLGIGVLVEPRAKVLGDGFAANQPPPAGETEVRYKYDSRYAVLILASFTF